MLHRGERRRQGPRPRAHPRKGHRRRACFATTPLLSDEEMYALVFAPGFSTATRRERRVRPGRGHGRREAQRRRPERRDHACAAPRARAAGSASGFRSRSRSWTACRSGLAGTSSSCRCSPSASRSGPSRADIKTVLGRAGRDLPVARRAAAAAPTLAAVWTSAGAVEDAMKGIVVVTESDGRRFGVLVDDVLGPAAGRGEEHRAQLPQGRVDHGRHHSRGRPRGLHRGRGRTAPRGHATPARRRTKRRPPVSETAGSRRARRGGRSMNEQPSRTACGDAAEGTAQYLTFTLGGEEYGVDILRVQEIKGYSRGHVDPERARVRQGRDESARHGRARVRHAPEVRHGGARVRSLHGHRRRERRGARRRPDRGLGLRRPRHRGQRDRARPRPRRRDR